MSYYRWVNFSFAILLAVVLLGACSSDKPVQVTANKTDTESINNGTPKHGGHFKIFDYADPETLDPHKNSGAGANNRIGLVYNKLVNLSIGPDKFASGEIIPELAQKWDVSEDGKVYTFHLREDVKWQDVSPVNGRPFIADDVLATMERIANLPGHQAGFLNKVENIEAPDDHTVVFTLSEPYAPFLSHFASYFMWILPKEATEGKIDLDNTAIGTGPFILEKWNRNVEATYIKNPNYFEEGKPYLDQVTIFPKGDATKELNGFRTGQVDVLTTDSPMVLENAKSSIADAEIQTELYGATRLFINQTRTPLDNLLVRKAISKAIDRERAWDSIYGGGGYTGYLLPSLEEWILPLEDRKAYQEYDPEGAKELLAEAGYPDGFEISMIVTDAYGPLPVTLAEWVVEDLKAVGIKVNIEVLEYATFFSKRWPSLEYDIGIGLVTPVTDPSETLIPYFKSDGFRNWQGVNDPKLDEMLMKQDGMMNVEERKQLVNEIERYLFEEVSNHVNLVGYQLHYIKQPYVKGHTPHFLHGNAYMKNVWLDK